MSPQPRRPPPKIDLRPVGKPSVLLENIGLFTPDKKVKQKLDLSILDAELEMTIEGASTLTLKIHDEERGLLRSQLTREASMIELDELSYTLVKVAREGDMLTLTFEETAVNLLRRYDKPLKQKRYDADGVTRAQFIRLMVDEVKEARIPFACPEVDEKQPVRPVSTDGAARAGPGGQTATPQVRLWE